MLAALCEEKCNCHSYLNITRKTSTTTNEHESRHFGNQSNIHTSSENYEEIGYGLDFDSLHILSRSHVSHPTQIGIIKRTQAFKTHLPHNSIATIEGGKKLQERMLKRYMLDIDQITSSNSDNHSQLKGQHNQQDLYDHLKNKRIITLTMTKIASVRAPRTTRKLAMASISVTLTKHFALIV
jgi:hypothetical protein